MTEAEVELIYNYLHENYEYRDGELIRKKWLSGTSKLNKSVGTLSIPNNSGRLVSRISFVINAKRKCMNLDRAIYLYHHRYIPFAINHIDDNPTNNKIENLQKTSSKTLNNKNIKNWSGVKTYRGKNRERYYPYLLINGKEKTLGGYDYYQEAHAAYLKAKEEYASK